MAESQVERKVPYVRLGNSGLNVSVPILGCMSYGTTEWQPWVLNEEDALPLMKAAWDRGINTFDTANVYSNGESEKLIAKFIEKYEIPRKELIILTKCHGVVGKNLRSRVLVDGPSLKKQREYINQYGLSRAAIFNAVNDSLERLKTPYIDLLQIHRYDSDTPAEETMKALHDLVESGKVRYIGASSMRTWQFAHLQEVAGRNGWTKFVSMQNEISLLYREEEREMLPYCAFNGIGVIPWGPLALGQLTRPVDQSSVRFEEWKKYGWYNGVSEAEKAIIGRVEEIAKKREKSMAQVALAWAQAKVTSPIVGISSIERLDASILGDFTLSDEEKKYLEESYVPRPVRGHE